jgi:hypothetical protein
VKKADCPEFRRMIQCGILNEMFIHPRRKKKIENKISLMDLKGPNNDYPKSTVRPERSFFESAIKKNET